MLLFPHTNTYGLGRIITRPMNLRVLALWPGDLVQIENVVHWLDNPDMVDIAGNSLGLIVATHPQLLVLWTGANVSATFQILK